MKNLIFSIGILTTLSIPAFACGPSGSTLLLGLGLLLSVFALVIAIQFRAYPAAMDFMRGITPDRGAPYWLALGFLLDLGVMILWDMSGFAAAFGLYLLVSGLPKLLMTLAGFSREYGAVQAARAHY